MEASSIKNEKNWREYILFTALILIVFGSPNSYSILPESGKWLSKLLQPFISSLSELIFTKAPTYSHQVFSDSHGYITYLLFLLLISLLIGSVLFKTGIAQKWVMYSNIQLFASYFLAIQFLKYGFDKVILHQFTFPEANILYTPLGQLSKDVLFWSTMGTSKLYSIVTGSIEILVAIMLLLKKVRVLGGYLSILILTQILLLNFSFDITVKAFIILLLLVAMVIVYPSIKRVYHFFVLNEEVKLNHEETTVKSKRPFFIKHITKAVILAFLFLETLWPLTQPTLNVSQRENRAYEILGNESPTLLGVNDVSRFFIHSKNFLIIQDRNGKMKDYKIEERKENSYSIISSNERKNFSIITLNDSTVCLTIMGKDTIKINAAILSTNKLPLVLSSH